MYRSLHLLLLLFVVACANPDEGKKKKKKAKVKEGLVQSYRKDGSLSSEVNYKEGKKEGLAKDYYKDGQVHYEINYRGGQKNGITKWYHENGELYMSCNYTDNQRDGIETKYYEGGKMMSEMPWKNNMPGLGLKEYSKEGKLLTKYPAIEFEVKDQIAMNGEYTIKISMSDNYKNAKFWRGQLIDGEYLDEYKSYPLRTINGVAIIHYKLSPGQFVMEKLNIIAKMKTRKRNYFVTQKAFNLAIDKRAL